MFRLLVALAFVAGPAMAQEKAPVVARAEACLRANVDRVVAVEPNLQSAASFLVSYSCANETSRAAQYERNTAWLASMRSWLKGMNEWSPQAAFGNDIDASVDPETGEFAMHSPKPGAKPNPLTNMLPQMSAQSSMIIPEQPSPSLRKLAGDLVLAARERQTAKTRR